MNGSGNDFILIDQRADSLKGVFFSLFARTICRRELVGADGLILVENSNGADFKWRFFNSDGSEAEMCGNGGRCAARFAFQNGIAGRNLSFETLAGIIHAQVKNNRVKLQLPQPNGLKLNQKISLDDKDYSLGIVNTGVPHAVLVVQDLEKAPIQELGRKIRFHPAFQPAGANVNFIQVIDENQINIRTYERGVEDETLACGTGSAAAVLVSGALKQVKSPVEAHTRGGEVLTVYFDINNANALSQVYLEGDTCLVFEGTLGEDVWREYEKLKD